MDEQQQADQVSINKKVPRWLKWIIFYLLGILSFIIGQALMDFNVVSSKWWLIGLIMAFVYWWLFVRSSAEKMESTVKYDWRKRK